MIPISVDVFQGMNKTEARYASDLILRVLAKEIIDWRFEPFNLKLADHQCFYKVDFMLVHQDYFQFVEIKGGHIYDDAVVKFKVAKKEYPWFKFTMLQWKNKREGWIEKYN